MNSLRNPLESLVTQFIDLNLGSPELHSCMARMIALASNFKGALKLRKFSSSSHQYPSAVHYLSLIKYLPHFPPALHLLKTVENLSL